jgi:hypothetical protein
MAYPKLPEEAQNELDNMAREYALRMYAQDYDSALATVTRLYEKMLHWQSKYRQRFHKGYPIHNIGYTLYRKNKVEDALKYFILAYIEDLISAESENEADSTPAGRMLIEGYGLDPNLLSVLKQKVQKLKKQNNIPLTPEEVLQEKEAERAYESYKDVGTRFILVETQEEQRRPFAKFESDWEKRVFVGGSFGLYNTLDHIARIVRRLGFDPIVSLNFLTPQGVETHQKCLTLLHCCKYAIFDLSEQAGQLMELERVKDYDIKALVIWPKNKEHAVTQMLKTLSPSKGIEYKSYVTNEDIDKVVQEFLSK